MFQFVVFALLLHKHDTKETTVMIGGDVNFGGVLGYHVAKGHCTYNQSFQKIKKYFDHVDFSMVNLESSVGRLKEGIYNEKQVRIIAQPQSIEALKYVNVSVVSLANNHLLDFGEKIVVSTLKTLDAYHIPYSGVTFSKVNLLSKQIPVILESNGLKIGILSYCLNNKECSSLRNTTLFGPAIYHTDFALQEIEELRKQVSFIIVYIHWGIEYTVLPSTLSYKNIIRRLAPHVNVVIGSHQHVYAGHMYYNKTLVVHGIGNFLFPMHLSEQYKFNPDTNNNEKSDKAWYKMSTKFKNKSAFGILMKLFIDSDGTMYAKYLSIEINIDKQHCMYTDAVKNASWVTVCSENDKHCLGNSKCNEMKCRKKKPESD